jgi:copper(I)-binding protein
MKKLLTTIAAMIFYGIAWCQMFENFTDSNFTTNPTWSGDDIYFIINPNKELQSNGPQATSTLYLSTPNTLMDSAEWNFYVRLDFNPSSTNYVRIYLTSDQQNLGVNLNGYFVQFGEAGTAPDSLDIFRQSGSTVTKVVTGCMTSSGANAVRVKILRSNSGGVWQVYADCSGGTNYSFEGQFTDNTYTTTNHFGFHCRYSTASRYNMYYFDDISIAQIVADTVKPIVQSVNVISSSLVDVKFSEAVDLTSAQNTLNYFIDGGIGNPQSAQRDITDNTLVHLTLQNTLTSGTQYNITIQNVGDLAGNAMLPATLSLLYYIPSAGDVVINEIMADPTPQVNLPNGEFIELKNNKNIPVNISGWTFSDASSTVTITNTIIPADSFIVLCPNSLVDSFVSRGFSNIIIKGLSSLPSLNNSSDSLTLKNNNGNVIDVVVYSDAWYRDAVKKNGGWTLERIDAGNNCTGADNWIASTNVNGGTPGTRNSVAGMIFDTVKPLVLSYEIISLNTILITLSERIDIAQLQNVANYNLNNGMGTPQTAAASGLEVTLTFATNMDTSLVYILTVQNLSDCSGNMMLLASLQIIFYTPSAGDVVINEIMADPTPQVNLPNGEFIELKNNKNIPVNVSGWTFSDASSTVTITNTIVPADSFLILCPNSLVDSFAARGFSNILIKGLSSLPSLNNSSDSLTLRDLNGNVIDRVNYSDTWYRDAVKKNGGWTLERIDPITSCGEGLNWLASVDPNGGTPGRRNSVQGVFGDTTKPFIVAYDLVSASTIQITFSESVDAARAGNPLNYTLNNGMGNPQSATVSGLDVILIFSSPLDSLLTYQLTVHNITDCIGNVVSSAPVTIVIPRPAEPFDILMTELYPDPEPSFGLPNAEFVELFNRSRKAISLNGWKFSDATSTVMLHAKILFPGEYVIITSTSNVGLFTQYGSTLGVGTLPSLNNDGDALTLKDISGKTIHYVNYSSSWYQDNIKKNGGWTLEMIDTDNPCSGSSNWKASEAPIGGTPASVNSINGFNPDNTAPSLLYAVVNDSVTITLVFDESLDSMSIAGVNQFVITPGNISAISFKTIAPAFTHVQLTLNSALQTKIIYAITVSGMTDCAGNPVDVNTAQFGLPELPKQGDIIINEILFNPESFGSDFVEMYNISDKIIDLKSLFIVRNDYVRQDSVVQFARASESGFLLLPQNYVVLTADPAYIKARYFSENPNRIIEVKSMPNYPDKEGVVALKDTLLQTLDRVAYSEKWHHPMVDDKNGVSLERIFFNQPSQDKNNWHSAASTVGFATPAYKNSQSKDEAEVKEYITIEPEAFSPDNDGYNDFLNIYYRFDEPGWTASIRIFDSGGRLVRDLAKNELLATEGMLQWDGFSNDDKKARIGIHIIFIELFNPAGDVKKYKRSCVVAGKIE